MRIRRGYWLAITTVLMLVKFCCFLYYSFLCSVVFGFILFYYFPYASPSTLYLNVAKFLLTDHSF